MKYLIIVLTLSLTACASTTPMTAKELQQSSDKMNSRMMDTTFMRDHANSIDGAF